MKANKYPFYFIALGLISLLFGLLCGLLAGFQYVIPDFIKETLPFHAVRPLHTILKMQIKASSNGIFGCLFSPELVLLFPIYRRILQEKNT
jgi:nitric oxide reductase large subunit